MNQTPIPIERHQEPGTVRCGDVIAVEIEKRDGRTVYGDVQLASSQPGITADQLQRIAAIVAEPKCRFCADVGLNVPATTNWGAYQICEPCYEKAREQMIAHESSAACADHPDPDGTGAEVQDSGR